MNCSNTWGRGGLGGIGGPNALAQTPAMLCNLIRGVSKKRFDLYCVITLSKLNQLTKKSVTSAYRLQTKYTVWIKKITGLVFCH